MRNFVDAVYGSSERFRRAIGSDPRRFYYPFMVLLAIVISVIIFRAPPTELLQWAANMSDLAALVRRATSTELLWQTLPPGGRRQGAWKVRVTGIPCIAAEGGV